MSVSSMLQSAVKLQTFLPKCLVVVTIHQLAEPMAGRLHRTAPSWFTRFITLEPVSSMLQFFISRNFCLRTFKYRNLKAKSIRLKCQYERHPYLVILGDACQAGLISDATVDCSRSLNAIVERVFINFGKQKFRIYTFWWQKCFANLPINRKYILLIETIT